LRAGQVFLYFTSLGFLADYHIFSSSMGKEFEWKKLAQFENLADYTAFASVFATSLGTTASQAIAGHLDTTLRELVTLAFQQLPKLPF
jgi:hypothetical protein